MKRRLQRVTTRARVAVHAWLAFVTITVLLRKRPLPSVVPRLTGSGPRLLPPVPPHRLGQMVYRSLTVGPFHPRCLITSLVHLRLLRSQGHHADLVIGLSPDRHGKDAHAWVEIDGTDVGPPPGKGSHQELVRYR